jgi:hypothetical protein
MAKRKVFMRTTVGAMVLLVSAIVFFSMTPKAPGQYEIGGAYINIDPKARGTLLNVTLTIHYVYIPPTVPSPCQKNKVIKILPDFSDHGFAAGPFFMRVVMGGVAYGYSSNFSATTTQLDTLSDALCTGNFNGVNFIAWDDVDAQEKIIDEFLKTRIIPDIFPDNPNATYAIKSQSLALPVGGDVRFTMFDIVLAVR